MTADNIFTFKELLSKKVQALLAPQVNSRRYTYVTRMLIEALDLQPEDSSVKGLREVTIDGGIASVDFPQRGELAQNRINRDIQLAPRPSFLRNSVSNVLRIGITSVVSILLPTFLTHRLPVQTYGAWVLILQMSAYVSYLNLGVQTAVSKYIAEYDATHDLDGCGHCASVGLRIMLLASLLGIVLSAGLAYFVPSIFHGMPLDLVHSVRVSILLVGFSLSIGLSSSIFSAIFLGLQRYDIPMVISVASRLLFGVVVFGLVTLHFGLIAMAIATASLNLLTSTFEVLACRRFCPSIKVRLRNLDRRMLRQMLAYCSILTIWSACMLFISGLDVTIVGHFAFNEVAFYSIANSPTNLMLLIVGSLLGPLLPVTSALSVTSSPERMGEILHKSTRYSTIALLLTGLPALVAGYPLLRLWVGPKYAMHSIVFLHLLLLANIIRNLGGPYATMVVAVSQQRVGTASAVTEGVVNLVCSIVLARHIGAMGVALGTVIGAVAGVAMHFGITMHYTRKVFAISRATLFAGGILRPAAMAIPSLLLYPRWWTSGQPKFALSIWILWVFSTAILGWFVSALPADRSLIKRLVSKRLFAPPV